MDVPLIHTVHMGKRYQLLSGDLHALTDVNVNVQEGEFIAVMGPSGSGKSTFMNLLGCLDVPSEGDYYLSGRVVKSMTLKERAHLRNALIGFVFQGYNLLPRLNCVENVALPLVYAGIPTRERREQAREKLVDVGLERYTEFLPPQLSGGQQQRVAIARALVNNASLLLADEPTGNLDSRTSDEIIAIFERLNRERRLTIVLVTHEPDVARHARRLIRFHDGCVVEDGPVSPSPPLRQALP
ncbi:MAG: ABC transporter ATP-binding protein [Gammaproteobacteria bacterium]|nr:ABC transporter ATP-binding protein [Gammaproteobacteria bacterium]